VRDGNGSEQRDSESCKTLEQQEARYWHHFAKGNPGTKIFGKPS